MKIFTKIIYWFLIVVALIQFIPVDRTNKPVAQKADFVHIFQTPGNVKQILKQACYDCHSNETIYPDYAYVAPVSWSIKNHITNGRKHLNLSEWGNLNKDLRKNMLENSAKSVKNFSMPMSAYITKHPTANLTKEERVLLTDYFNAILTAGNF